MSDTFDSVRHTPHPQGPGLYATPDLPGIRGQTVIGIVFTLLLAVGFGTLIVLAWFWDSSSAQGGKATAWFFTIVFLPGILYGLGMIRVSVWRIAILQRRIPIVAFSREGLGLAVVPVRYMGLRNGRVTLAKRRSDPGGNASLILKRGDEVNFSIVGPDSIPRRNHIRLLLDARDGYFRCRAGLNASELDLEGFEVFMTAEGISLSIGSLYDS